MSRIWVPSRKIIVPRSKQRGAWNVSVSGPPIPLLRIPGSGALTVSGQTAQVSVQSVASGGLAHGGGFTISGTGFGTKNTPHLQVADVGAAANGSLDSQWSGSLPRDSSTLYNMHNRDLPFNGGGTTISSGPHQFISRILAGCHRDAIDYYTGWNVMAWKNFDVASFPASLFASCWYRMDPAFVFNRVVNGNPADNNFKLTDYSRGTEPYDLPNNWYIENKFSTIQSASDSVGENINWHIVDDGGSLEQNGGFIDAAGHSWTWNSIKNPFNAANGWIYTEFEVSITNQTGTGKGFVNLWEDGIQRMNYQGATDRYTGTARNFAFGGYNRNQGLASQWRYYADLRFDFNPGTRFCPRVCVGDANTFAACTRRVWQDPDSWTNTDIHVPAFWRGALNTGLRYPYVVTSAGTVISGTAVTVV